MHENHAFGDGGAGFGHAAMPTGRLVLVIEKTLTEPSRLALRRLLATLLRDPDVTMVAGTGRASVMAAAREGGRIFYNRAEYLTPDAALALMPWRSVWLVGGGRVWRFNGLMD
jgi:hypothetical protein